MLCDYRIFKKLIIIAFCVTVVVLIANIDENVSEYSAKELTQNFDENAPVNMARMENTSLLMEKRRRELNKNCRILGLDLPGDDLLHKPNAWEYMINHRHRLVWCNVFKAASTSWMYNFNVLAGYKPDFLQKSKQVPLQLARKKYPRPTLKELEKALNTSTSFLIVRHPMERLLSAYRDKIEFAIPNSYHHKLGTSIISKYRDKAKLINRNQQSRNFKRPTFQEFVQYLFDLEKSNSSFDMHWVPITNFCTPCQVRIDIIIKFETMQDDQNYLIHTRKLQRWIKPEWKNPTKGKSNTTSLIEKYYSQLTKQQIEQIYNIYRYDFQLFGYTLDNYLKYGIPT